MTKNLFSDLEAVADGQTAFRPGKPIALPPIEPLPEPHPDYRPDFLGARVTLDSWPAKIMGRSGPMARIEPIDLDGPEPIHCTWDAVADVVDNCDGRFCTEADDDQEPI